MMLAGNTCSIDGAGAGRRLRQGGFGGSLRQFHARAGTHQVDRGEPQKQRERGDDFEVDDGFQADAAHALQIAAARDAIYQRAENQRRDDGADQPQEDGADRAELPRYTGRKRAQSHARGHADEDPGSQRQALQRSPHFSFWRSTSKNIMRGGRIRCSAYSELRQTTASSFFSGSPIWPSMVR